MPCIQDLEKIIPQKTASLKRSVQKNSDEKKKKVRK
jgi:hypothetical protein